LLAHLGYEVAAVTGKRERWDWLKGLGASQILSREMVLIYQANGSPDSDPLRANCGMNPHRVWEFLTRSFANK
jgi:hypothetical protein